MMKAKNCPYYVADNGVTVKARDWVDVGRTGRSLMEKLGVAEVGQ